MTTITERCRALGTRLRPRAFHPDLQLLSRLLPGGIVSGPLTLSLVRRATTRPPKGGFTDRAGTVPALVFRPAEGTVRGAVLWLHGGGMVMGTPAQDASACQRMADELGALVVAPDYRLAPEHPYPAPIEDCYQALSWLAALPEVSGSPIVVAGASAGGGLAAGVAVMARDRAEVDLAGQVLVYPMLDDRTATRSDPGAAHRRLWNDVANKFGWRSYLGREPGSAEITAYAAPARLQDLRGLPRTWLGVGNLDLFHDEDVQYAERLRKAGVPCETEVVQGAFHGFDVLPTDIGRSFVSTYVAAMGRMLNSDA